MIFSSKGARPGMRLCDAGTRALAGFGRKAEAPSQVVGVVVVLGNAAGPVAVSCLEWRSLPGGIPHGLPHSEQKEGAFDVMSLRAEQLMQCARILVPDP